MTLHINQLLAKICSNLLIHKEIWNVVLKISDVNKVSHLQNGTPRGMASFKLTAAWGSGNLPGLQGCSKYSDSIF